MSEPRTSNGGVLPGIPDGPVREHLKLATMHPLIRRNAEQAQAAIDYVSKVTPEQRRQAREKQQRQIAEGYIDLGPVPDHSTPVTDIRDMRDSELLATQIIYAKHLRGDCQTLSQAYDSLAAIGFETTKYTGEPIDHAELRRQELQHRADCGDKFAIALLRGETLAEEPVD
jgi:hypothetical protein